MSIGFSLKHNQDWPGEKQNEIQQMQVSWCKPNLIFGTQSELIDVDWYKCNREMLLIWQILATWAP